MSKFIRSFTALPLDRIARPDVVFALGLAFIIGMLIVPFPPFVLDGLIALNIGFAVTILMVAVFSKRTLEFSSFPTLLLVTTMFRLGLNVSTTRGILAKADAGQVVASFGKFVLQGDVVVGFVVFLVITLVQFLVIAKGSERVAEVAARFTLDAMPGKQMSIEAASRGGAITEDEAQTLREELGRESQLFGNMDGAMKFVKGDAIAGLIITALNLIAGFVIGVVRLGFSFDEALSVYSVLTVGDGLVSQIAALLVTIAAGVLVTRVETKKGEGNIGQQLRLELITKRAPLAVAATLMLGLALVPGLPALPFLAITSGIGAFLFIQKRRQDAAQIAHSGTFAAQLDEKLEQAHAQKSVSDSLAPSVLGIGLDLDPVLSRLLGFHQGNDTELMKVYMPQLRDALYLDTGVRYPGARVCTDVAELSEGTFVVRIKDVPVFQASIPTGHQLAMAEPQELERIGVTAKPIPHPISGTDMSLVPDAQCDAVRDSGVALWNPAGIIALYLAAILRREAKEFLGLQEVGDLVERLESAYPTLVSEVVPKVVSLSQLVDILRRLVDEGVSIRDLKSIIEALGEHGTATDDGVFLTEKARASLGRQLAYRHAGLDKRLPVLLVDPIIEETVEAGITSIDGGYCLAIEPEISRAIVESVYAATEPMRKMGLSPVILTHARIRRYLHKLLDFEIPGLAVLSFDELPSDLSIQPLGRAQLAA